MPQTPFQNHFQPHPSLAAPPPLPASPPPDGRMLLRMARWPFLSLTVSACVLGFAFAWSCDCGFDGWLAALTLGLALMAHAGANMLNDFYDARSGADAANTRALTPFSGGSRLIQHGQVSAQEMGRWGWALLALVALGGLVLLVRSGSGLFWLGVGGLLLAWAYTAPPLQLAHRGLGELATGLAWWLVVLGADYVQRGQFHIVPAFTAVGFALLVMNVLLVNGFADAPADAQVGKNTLVVRLGLRGAAALSALLVLLAHGWLVLGVWLLIPPPKALWALSAAPFGLASAALLWRYARQVAQGPLPAVHQLRPAVILAIAACLLHAWALAAGLVATRV